MTDSPYCLGCDEDVDQVCPDCRECSRCCHCADGPSERQIEAQMDQLPYFSTTLHFTDKDRL